MDELVAWLRQQITADREHASLAGAAAESREWVADDHNIQPPETIEELVQPIVKYVYELECAQHIGTWDPARVIAECDAKLRILVEHEQYTPPLDLGQPVCCVCHNGMPSDFWEGSEGLPYPCLTVRLLAQPYQDRPGFQDGWRTDGGKAS